MHETVSRNCYARRQVEFGDVEAALAAADVIIEREIIHPRITGAPMECRGVLAAPHGKGMTVWLSAQNPHAVHTAIVRVLGIDESELNVIVPEVGGGFGLKGHVYPEDILVPWLALTLDQPVQWIEDRLEHLSCSNHARDQRVRIRAGLTNEGRVIGLEAHVTSDVGAYGVHPMGPLLDLMTCSGLIPGPYDIRNYSYDSAAMVTNKAPGGAFRGVGMTTAALVHERMMDIAAHELGLDPAEIRRRNLVPAELMPYTTVTSHPYESGDFFAALDAALEAFDYEQARIAQERARARKNRGDRNRRLRRGDGRRLADLRRARDGRRRGGRSSPPVARSGRRGAYPEHLPGYRPGKPRHFRSGGHRQAGSGPCAVVIEHTDTAKVGRGFGTGMSRSSPPVRRASGERRTLREAILEATGGRLEARSRT